MVDEYYLHHKDEADTEDIYPQFADGTFEDMLVLREDQADEPMAVDSLRAILGTSITDTRPGISQGPCARDELQRVYKL